MTTTNTKPRYSSRWNDEMERTLAAHGVTDESIAATVAAHNAAQAAGLPRRIVGGSEMYRDHGTREDYTVGYGGERNYARPAAAPRTVNGLSEKQVKLVDDLLREKVHEYTEAQVAEAKADWRKGRPMIDALLKAPRRPWQAPVVEVAPEPAAPAAERLDFAAIPDGYYALRVDGVVKFYRVSTSKRSFKNVQAQASDNLFPMNWKAGIAILHRLVEAGLEDSQKLYAQELGRCYVCGRTLTDDTSRELGIGPICREK